MPEVTCENCQKRYEVLMQNVSRARWCATCRPKERLRECREYEKAKRNTKYMGSRECGAEGCDTVFEKVRWNSIYCDECRVPENKKLRAAAAMKFYQTHRRVVKVDAYVIEFDPGPEPFAKGAGFTRDNMQATLELGLWNDGTIFITEKHGRAKVSGKELKWL